MFTEFVGALATSLGTHTFPPTSLRLDGDNIVAASSWTLPGLPTSDNILENINKTGVEAVMTVPTFIDDWATEADDKTIAILRQLRIVAFGGGPLAFDKGEALASRGVKLRSTYGGTEVGFYLSSTLEEHPE
jgi:acyl-coenzyme A synthetase/AMP-(fatty) acid ligase